MLKIEKHARNVKVTEMKESETKCRYIIEPLYRGYGHTVGNALRRVLLSSIPGTAIKGIRIDGALNEFSTIEGIKEAVTDIVLNIKEIVVKMDTPEEKKMILSVKGPKVVTAADIRLDSEIEIINPDQYICTVVSDRELDIEFLVGSGESFVVADDIEKKDWPVDYIAIDAIYTPIRKVSYSVEDMMVGRVTDFDKLSVDVESDGSIEIRDAISYAVELLQFHLNPLLEIGDKMENLRGEYEEEEEEVESENSNDILYKMKIEELDLTVRSFNCLKKVGIEEVGGLARLSMSELLKIKNLGRKSLDEILDKMKELGIDLNANEGNE